MQHTPWLHWYAKDETFPFLRYKGFLLVKALWFLPPNNYLGEEGANNAALKGHSSTLDINTQVTACQISLPGV